MSCSNIKPPALKAGDTVGVIAPAAAVDREFLERGVQALSALGYRVKVSERALARNGILAGTDQERAAELMSYFADQEVNAIFTARAGYGAGRLLPLIDFAAIARHPKIFLGFSDQTFLLNAIVRLSRMVCFHGPMVATDFARGPSQRSLDHTRALLAGESAPLRLKGTEVIHPGVGKGELIGGCLSVLVAMLGTPYAPDFDGKLLLLEDVGEKPYRIDRMLVQLKQAGALSRLNGIAIGGMRGADGSEQEERLMKGFVAEQTAAYDIPVLAGIEAGHRTQNLTVPLGVAARLDSNSLSLSISEPPVS